MNRITLNLGIRLDYVHRQHSRLSPVAVDHHAASQLRRAGLHVGASEGHHAEDRRVAWDVRGDGKTALKVNFAQVRARPVAGGEQSAHRAQPVHHDADGDAAVDGQQRQLHPGLRPHESGRAGAEARGRPQPGRHLRRVTGAGAMYANAPGTQLAGDDNARFGWGKRPYSWEFSVSAQRELAEGRLDLRRLLPPLVRQLPGDRRLEPRGERLRVASASARARFRRLASRPVAPRCRATSTRDQFFTPKPGHACRVRTTTSGLSDQLFPGSNVIDHWNGFDLSLNARLGHGVILQGGTSTGRQVTDTCDIVNPANAGKFGDRSPLVEICWRQVLGSHASSLNSCHVEQAWLTQLKFHRVVHGAEDRRPDWRVVSEHPRHRAVGDLRRPQQRHRPPRQRRAASVTCRSRRCRRRRRRAWRSFHRRPRTTIAINQLDLRLGKILRYGRPGRT